MQPASPQPCTLFCPRSGEMPEPGKPSCPVTSDRFRSAWALWMPLMCWVMPMPHTRQDPAKGGRAYQRAAWAMTSAGTPVSAAAHGPTEADRDHRVVGGGVGADDHQAAGLLVVDVRVRGGARAHGNQHRLH